MLYLPAFLTGTIIRLKFGQLNVISGPSRLEQLKEVDLIVRFYPFVLPLFFLSSASNTDTLAGIQQLLRNLRLILEIKSITRIMKQKR